MRGAYKVRIENPAKLLEKLIGNNVPYQFQEELNKYFESEFQGKIKSAISKFLNGLEQELIGIDAYMDELSEQIEPYIDEVVQDYGLKCVKFSLAGLDIDNSKYDEIDQSQIASISKVKLAQGDKGVMDVLERIGPSAGGQHPWRSGTKSWCRWGWCDGRRNGNGRRSGSVFGIWQTKCSHP